MDIGHSLQSIAMPLDKLSGVTNWTLHDLRRTWSTNAARWKLAPPHVVERALNHQTSSTLTDIARVYNRYTYMPELVELFERMEERLCTLFELERAAAQL